MGLPLKALSFVLLSRHHEGLGRREVSVLGRQVVRASSEVVLHQDAVASNDITLRVLLSEHHLTAEVRSLNNHVLLSQHEFRVELDAEGALEHRVREDAPL